VIVEFKKEFDDKPDVRKPEICDGMEHTAIFVNRESMLKQLTAEATLTLFHKKKLLRDEVLPDLNKLIRKEVGQQVNDLSGSVVDIFYRRQAIFDEEGKKSRRDSLVSTLSKSAAKTGKHLDGNWKRKDRSISPPLREREPPQERENTTSDIHIEIVGQQERINTSSDVHIEMVGQGRLNTGLSGDAMD
jgi:hypothetical protein